MIILLFKIKVVNVIYLLRRSRRTSTKLVTAATNSVVLQKNLDPSKSLSPVPAPSTPRLTRATPESSKTKARDHEKKNQSSVRSVTKTKEKNTGDIGKIKEEKSKNLSPKKRKRDVENDNTKKTKVADTEESVRRSRRETTRNSTLATLNSSLSDGEDKSRSVSSEPPVEEKKKRKSAPTKEKVSPDPVSPVRSKRRTTALSSLATKAALSQDRNVSVVSPPPAPSDDDGQSEPESEPEPIEQKPVRPAVKTSRGGKVKSVRRTESPGQRRSVRSTTAISTLASNNAASQAPWLVEESSDELEEEDQSSTESEDPYQETPRRSRGRPSKTKPPALSPNNPFAAVTREYKEQQKIVAKLNRKRKSSLSPDERPRLLSEEENNRLFDSLFDEGSEDQPEPPPQPTNAREKAARSRKATRSSKKVGRSSVPVSNSRDNPPPLSTKEMKTKSQAPKSEESDSRLPSLTWAKTSASTASSSRIVAPWRKLGEVDKIRTESNNDNDDIYEFGGPVGESGLAGKTEKSPERKMLLTGSRHGAYSGQLTALTWKQKLEQSNHLTRSHESQKSPNRPMFGSPRRDIGSPEGKKMGSISPKGSPRHEPSFRNSSPRSESSSKIGSPRSETSHKTGSPRVDPSHRIYSPRIDPSQRMGLPKVYGSPLSRMGARVGGSIKPSAGGHSSHQLSLTSLSSDYNIVAAVDKHHGATLLNTPPTTPASLPSEAQNPGDQNVKRKSFLLSRIFSKPPSKDQEDENTEEEGEDATATTSDIKYDEVEHEDKSKKPREDVKKERRQKAGQDVGALQDNTSKRPSRNSTRTLNFKEASSDSDSGQSNSSDLGGSKNPPKKKLVRNVRAENPLPTGSIVCTSCQR